MQRLAQEIERLKKEHSHRSLRPARGRDFTSNDYLGFSRHPALIEAVREALDKEGLVGAGGSRLLRGHHALHAELEARAAAFFASEAALYFSSGFLANFAVFGTLCARHDAVVFDERIHASMKEGIHASPATRYRARHNDAQSFADALQRARADGAKDIWIAVESVYSMDGDLAPLPELIQLARQYGATLIVDEAHATGVFGDGRGLAHGRGGENLICVHTCGKAFGVSGALVCGDAVTIDYLINKARPFIYSTAPPPVLAAALVRALALIDEEPWRREKVQRLAAFASGELRRRLGAIVPLSGSQIIPVILGEEARALAVAERLQTAGFDVRAIRPPTVPDGTSRLRLSINASQDEADIEALAAELESAIADCALALGTP